MTRANFHEPYDCRLRILSCFPCTVTGFAGPDPVDEASNVSRPLEPLYPVVFFDALRVKIRDEATVRSKAVYLALAVLPDGGRDILGTSATVGGQNFAKLPKSSRPRFRGTRSGDACGALSNVAATHAHTRSAASIRTFSHL
jgi:hypothetical protein